MVVSEEDLKFIREHANDPRYPSTRILTTRGRQPTDPISALAEDGIPIFEPFEHHIAFSRTGSNGLIKPEQHEVVGIGKAPIKEVGIKGLQRLHRDRAALRARKNP